MGHSKQQRRRKREKNRAERLGPRAWLARSKTASTAAGGRGSGTTSAGCSPVTWPTPAPPPPSGRTAGLRHHRQHQEHFLLSLREQVRASHQDPDAFAVTYRPARQRSFPGMVAVRCSITRKGVQCVRHCKGMCVTHYGAWNTTRPKAQQKPGCATLSALHRRPSLPGPRPPSPSYNSRGLCNYHARQWSKDNRRPPRR